MLAILNVLLTNCKYSPVLQLHVLELFEPVQLCLRAQRLACQRRDLAVESSGELLDHKSAVNADLVERLNGLNNPGSCGVHSHWSHTHVLHRQQTAEMDH